MASKAEIIVAIQNYVDGLESLDLRRALGNPANGPILLRGETLETGIAYVVPGFTDAILHGITAILTSSELIVFGSDVLINDTFLLPGFGTASANEIAIPIIEAWTLKKATARLLTPPSGISTATFTVRKNGSNTSAAITLSGTETEKSWSGLVPFIDGNKLSVRHTQSGTPNVATNAIVSLYFQKD